MIQDTRIRKLNKVPAVGGDFVVYWMQKAQRATDNHALEFAVEQANRLKQPLFVFFFLFPGYPEASARHYTFMLQGLEETRRDLADRGIPLVLRFGFPPDELARAAGNASLVVTDRGYLDIHRDWRRRAAEILPSPLIQVETDAVVPVETAYHKEAYSAAVIRPRIMRLLFAYLVPCAPRDLKYPAREVEFETCGGIDPEALVSSLGIDQGIPAVSSLTGGPRRAAEKLGRFIEEDLDRFDEDRNDPGKSCSSGLSPYIHFGQMSPLTAALAVSGVKSPGSERFLEELIVRRELAVNFCEYNRHYSSFAALPDWAGRTLARHAGDLREYVYSFEDLETGHTHDRYWNAAQKELSLTGGMHGYMRMYWGKKILQWSSSPREAFSTALKLNNRYALDGRDPNSYAGIAWCFGKHDRPWKEREIFGSVRYMNDKGLERKFDMQAYIRKVEH